MTSNHHALYDLGYTRTTMAFNKEQRYSDVEQISKKRLSSDCRLQLACMKSELLVIVGQHTTVNTFPGLVHTARQTMRVGNTRSRQSNRKEDAAEGRIGDWGEVVTRQPFENERLDHLLSMENRCNLRIMSNPRSVHRKMYQSDSNRCLILKALCGFSRNGLIAQAVRAHA